MSWSRTETMPWPIHVLWAVPVAIMLGIGVVCLDTYVGYLLILIGLVIAAVMIAFSVMRICIDETGVRAALLFGLLGESAAGERITSATVTQVHPLRDFGGWGLRFSPEHGAGLIMRAGPAVRITRRGGDSITLSCRDADEAVEQIRTRWL